MNPLHQSPAALALRDDLHTAAKRFMDAQDQAGEEYRQSVITATSYLGEQVAILFAAINDPDVRERFVALFQHHLPIAVAKGRALAIPLATVQ